LKIVTHLHERGICSNRSSKGNGETVLALCTYRPSRPADVVWMKLYINYYYLDFFSVNLKTGYKQ